ncbi:hypothetical protein KR222_001448 [Zaprionus bogoriensis]|nr:hypothetical protein KR222_001448 [Zaprionus bogoriensis]
MPQLKIPQLHLTKPATAEQVAAQNEHLRAAKAHNELLRNAIKQRLQQNDEQAPKDPTLFTAASGSGLQGQLAGGFTIPKLRTASGVPLEEPLFNIPLLNKLRSQNNVLELTQLEQKVDKLKLETGDKLMSIQEDSGPAPAPVPIAAASASAAPAPAPLIDLTSTVIAAHKNAPPRELATKVRNKQEAAAMHFNIPFISCERLRNRRYSLTEDSEEAPMGIVEQAGAVGSMLDQSVGYPNPRKPQLKYAATSLELQHLKLYKREDYGANIIRFHFDSPSPDEIVKLALQKSWRISRT